MRTVHKSQISPIECSLIATTNGRASAIAMRPLNDWDWIPAEIRSENQRVRSGLEMAARLIARSRGFPWQAPMRFSISMNASGSG